MSQPGPNDEQVLAEFCERFLRDRSEGSEHSLGHYLQAFPSHQDVVAREYLALLDGAAEPASPADPSDDPAALAAGGGTVGTYHLVRELGRGGQAAVWLAEDTRLQRPAAVKILHGVGYDARALDRFRREARLTSRLDDPGICPIYEIGFSGVPWIAMRYVEGCSLAEALRAPTPGLASPPATEAEAGPPLTPPTGAEDDVALDLSSVAGKLRFIELAARSLHVAHEAGVVHRDVKPPNIMVTARFRPVILDFGIALANEDGTPTLTMSGEIVGTPAYMAPEQIDGSRGVVDRRTDVYALGVTLFECLTGRRPYEGPTREALYRAILEDPVPDPRRHAPGIERDLALVVRCAMSREPAERYLSAQAFADDLARVRRREPISVRRPSPMLRLLRWSQRNPRLAAATGTVLALLVAALLLTVRLLDAERENSLAQAAQARALRDRADALEREAAAAERRSRLVEPAILVDLLAEPDGLWPRRPRMIAAYEAWLARAAEFSRRLDLRQRELAELRGQALPVRPEDEADHEALRRARAPELFAEIDAAQRVIANWNTMIAAEGRSDRERERLARRVEAETERLDELRGDPRFAARVLWRFADEGDAELHAALAKLALRRDALEDLRRKVQERLELTRDLDRQCRVDAAAAWERCIADVTRTGTLGPKPLRPQEGLVPLGRDRDSGLWEFWAPETGPRPGWEGPELGGTCVPGDESGMVLILLPAATFVVGCQGGDPEAPHYDPAAHPSESPPVEIAFDAFFIGKYEVTQAQWIAATGENPSEVPVGSRRVGISPATPRHPVERVSQRDGLEVAARLDLELPTEEQWEYAASSGRDTRWWSGDDPASMAGKANVGQPFDAPGFHDPHRLHAPVGSYPANPFGLHDTAGNVSEWTRSPWGPYRTPPRPGDGLRPASPSARNVVYRGGSFQATSIDSLRLSRRGANLPRTIGWIVGLRLARPVR